MMSIASLTPNWPVPKTIKAITTLRSAGNFAAHVGDDPQIVAQNRAHLIQALNLPQEPYWLNQTHSDIVIPIDENTAKNVPEADGSYTQLPNTVCAVLTADCLPILLCNKEGTEIAALHAGWKGILAHIIDSGVNCFQSPKKDLLAWFGPAIGPKSFEVGPEVFEAFTKDYPENKTAFIPSPKPNHFLLDIYQIARNNLNRHGINQIYGGNHCTYIEQDHFYSYRKQNKTGRMVTLIWRT